MKTPQPEENETMTPYRVIALDKPTAETIRTTLRAPFGAHPVHSEVAVGYGPCRQCLAYFEAGVERRILYTFDPFSGLEPLPLPGPAFIHQLTCRTYPENAGFPALLQQLPLTLNAYARGRRLLAQVYVSKGDVVPEIERLLGDPDVSYIHVRNTEAGCYICRLERQRTPVD